jgi:carboxyl-terminal processing protease
MMKRVLLSALALSAASLQAASPADYASDAKALDQLIAENYAYLDRFGGAVPTSPKLDAERDAVKENDALLHYAEDKLAALADHHAIAGRSFRTSWALVPSYADLWIVADAQDYAIDSVRADSPAAQFGIVSHDRLIAIDGVPIDQAVARFWNDLGFRSVTDPERRAYAARVLAAGRRDRQRVFSIDHAGQVRAMTLASLYHIKSVDRPPLTVSSDSRSTTIRFNDSLGRRETIVAFDEAMAQLRPNTRLILDLTDTGSGGDSLIARAVMGWFIEKPHFYQMHHLVAEERETGIVRQWVEQVLPRTGKHFAGPVSIHVGRWTGSMGEGMAIGFMALKKPVCGGAMAGLRGAIYDFPLPATGLVVKFPAERLYTTGGIPREAVVPPPCR